MEQDEKLEYPTAYANRKVGQVLADLSNMRDWLWSPAAGVTGLVGAPPDGSVARAMLAPAPVTLSAEQLAAIAQQLAGTIGALREQLVAEVRDAVADLGEGGAAQVRADE